jgi:hypothetical protein
MGKTTTPRNRVEFKDNPFNPNKVQIQEWKGKASNKKLEEWVRSYAKSLESGGVNSGVSEMLGYIPYPLEAKIVDQFTGEEKAHWKAGTFQVW